MVSYLWNTIGLRIDSECVKTFWAHHRTVASPWTDVCRDAPDTMIPLGIYGDSARARQLPYSAPEKVVGIFMNCPLFRPKSVRQSRWLLFVLEEELLVGRETLNAVYRRLTWSFNILRHGLKPTRGPSNEQLSQSPGVPITADGYKFFLCWNQRGLGLAQVYIWIDVFMEGRDQCACLLEMPCVCNWRCRHTVLPCWWAKYGPISWTYSGGIYFERDAQGKYLKLDWISIIFTLF